jgi:hypothetical protein
VVDSSVDGLVVSDVLVLSSLLSVETVEMVEAGISVLAVAASVPGVDGKSMVEISISALAVAASVPGADGESTVIEADMVGSSTGVF